MHDGVGTSSIEDSARGLKMVGSGSQGACQFFEYKSFATSTFGGNWC